MRMDSSIDKGIELSYLSKKTKPNRSLCNKVKRLLKKITYLSNKKKQKKINFLARYLLTYVNYWTLIFYRFSDKQNFVAGVIGTDCKV